MSQGIPKPRNRGGRKSKNYNAMLGYQSTYSVGAFQQFRLNCLSTDKPSVPKAAPVNTPSQSSINASLIAQQQVRRALMLDEFEINISRAVSFVCSNHIAGGAC